MHADSQIRSAFQAMMLGFDVPPLPMTGITRRIADPTPIRERLTLLRAAVAAAILVAIPFAISPSKTVALIESTGRRLADIVLWTPPPPPPKALVVTDRAEVVDLASAQARVSFRIVPPSGLPSDVTSQRITLLPTLVYSKITHRWSRGEPVVAYDFKRTRGREIGLIAERYDVRFGPPPAFMFEDDSTGGRMLVKHRHFAWRNGDQMMSTSQNRDVSATEIQAIRDTMGGVPIPGATTRSELNSGTLIKRIDLVRSM